MSLHVFVKIQHNFLNVPIILKSISNHHNLYKNYLIIRLVYLTHWIYHHAYIFSKHGLHKYYPITFIKEICFRIIFIYAFNNFHSDGLNKHIFTYS